MESTSPSSAVCASGSTHCDIPAASRPANCGLGACDCGVSWCAQAAAPEAGGGLRGRTASGVELPEPARPGHQGCWLGAGLMSPEGLAQNCQKPGSNVVAQENGGELLHQRWFRPAFSMPGSCECMQD